MERERPIWLYLAVLVFVLFVGAASWQSIFAAVRGSAEGGGRPAPRSGPFAAGAVEITIASSSTKRDWMDESVKAFNAASQSDPSLQIDGRPVAVEALLEEPEPGRKAHWASGRMIRDTLQGKIRPTIVSPADRSWLVRLNREWRLTRGGGDVTTAQAQSLARTTVIVAMWESRARALGCWPTAGQDCTWQRVRALAASPDGWGGFGRADWGRFKFGYGYVGESGSGTETAVMLCRSGAGKAVLEIEDVAPENGCGRAMADVEQAKVHSGTSSSFLLGQLQSGGPEYLEAATTNESEVINFNRQHAGRLREPLVAAYPQDGTIEQDHPFAILDGADWVSSEQAEAARVFRRYLLSEERQRALVATGLRPGDPGVRVGPPFERVNGVDPAANLVLVPAPDPLVADRIVEVWHRVKKPAVIVLVFDKSGSMGGAKIAAAVKGAQEFVRRMDRGDRIIWLPFDSTVHPATEGVGSEIGEELVQRIASTSAGGGTALYDAVLRAFDLLEPERLRDPLGKRYGIVVLSDGQDTNSRSSLSQVEARLRPHEGDPSGIQIHTIAIGKDADANVLTKIATAAHGRFWKGQTTQDMELVYRNIATYY